MTTASIPAAKVDSLKTLVVNQLDDLDFTKTLAYLARLADEVPGSGYQRLYDDAVVAVSSLLEIRVSFKEDLLRTAFANGELFVAEPC